MLRSVHGAPSGATIAFTGWHRFVGTIGSAEQRPEQHWFGSVHIAPSGEHASYGPQRSAPIDGGPQVPEQHEAPAAQSSQT
jgi:hypothetical protein